MQYTQASRVVRQGRQGAPFSVTRPFEAGDDSHLCGVRIHIRSGMGRRSRSQRGGVGAGQHNRCTDKWPEGSLPHPFFQERFSPCPCPPRWARSARGWQCGVHALLCQVVCRCRCSLFWLWVTVLEPGVVPAVLEIRLGKCGRRIAMRRHHVRLVVCHRQCVLQTCKPGRSISKFTSNGYASTLMAIMKLTMVDAAVVASLYGPGSSVEIVLITMLKQCGSSASFVEGSLCDLQRGRGGVFPHYVRDPTPHKNRTCGIERRTKTATRTRCKSGKGARICRRGM